MPSENNSESRENLYDHRKHLLHYTVFSGKNRPTPTPPTHTHTHSDLHSPSINYWLNLSLGQAMTLVKATKP